MVAVGGEGVRHPGVELGCTCLEFGAGALRRVGRGVLGGAVRGDEHGVHRVQVLLDELDGGPGLGLDVTVEVGPSQAAGEPLRGEGLADGGGDQVVEGVEHAEDRALGHPGRLGHHAGGEGLAVLAKEGDAGLDDGGAALFGGHGGSAGHRWKCSE